MSKLNSKTTRGVAALALLAGSLFATNASAEYVETYCTTEYPATSCVSPGKIQVKPYGTFYLKTDYFPAGTDGTVKVFTVTGKNILYQGKLSVSNGRQLRGYGSTSTYQVAITGVALPYTDTDMSAWAKIYRN